MRTCAQHVLPLDERPHHPRIGAGRVADGDAVDREEDAVDTARRDAAIIASRQMGPAPSTPARSSIGAPSALPTQTPIAIFGVNPSVHVSRNPVLVPVFTAAGKGTSNGVTPPNPGIRASGSERMSESRYACSGLRTRRVDAGMRSYSTRPDPSRTRATANGSVSRAARPIAAYALVRSTRRTSPEPSVSERP